MYLGDPFFGELRLYGQADYDRLQLAEGFRDRLDLFPERIEQYMVRINPSEYWKIVAFRYPPMIRFLHRYTRVGVEDEQAVINVVLPPIAAHNLVFGGEMLLSSVPGAAGEGPSTQAPPKGPQTLDELLATPFTFGFDQTSLEFAMRDITVDVKETFASLPFDLDIKILGPDLQLNGITRNQQIRDFRKTDTPLSEILTAIVMRANPITTVKDPSEDDQKLIWVVGPDPDNPNKQAILITTRDGAIKKQYTLPPAFRSK
jgi:hypothetical protein